MADLKECALMDDDNECDDVDWEEEDDDQEEEDADQEEEDDDNELIGDVKCLFCDEVFKSASLLFDHCKEQHHFNIKEICIMWNLDCISYIKMINYTRKMKPCPKDISKRKVREIPPWKNDEYMKPADCEDLLLQYDIESLSMDSELTKPSDSDCLQRSDRLQNGDGLPHSDGDHDEITLSTTEYHQLLQQLHMSESRAESAERELVRAEEDLNKLRTVAKEFMLSQPAIPTGPPTIEHLKDNEDESYFDSYSHFDIHHEMLQDKVRTESYRDFMLNNKEYFKDKIVLDVGCGTGILSMFAVKAGASHVIGVDQSEIIYQAMDIVRENGLEDKITLLKGRLEEVELPYKQVDIIISEWMGYFLLFESMLDTIIVARDRYLKPGGMVFPDICTISITAISDFKLYNKDVYFWDDVYGFKMSCLKSDFIKEACVDIINKDTVVTDPCVFKTVDVSDCKLSDLQFKTEFNLTMTKDGEITAFVGYFNIYFQKHLSQPVEFSTGPEATPTHWKQTVFLLPKPFILKKGEKIKGILSCKKNRKDPRSLVISFKYNDKKHIYIME